MKDFYKPGWVDDPESVEIICELQPFSHWGKVEASNVPNYSLPDHVFPWEMYEQLTGKPWPSRSQGSVGSCVGFGTVAAIEATIVAEVFNNEPEDVRDLCTEVCYAGSRVEVGKNKIPARSDGSIGAWAAEFCKSFGVIDRGVYLKYDLKKYDEARCRNWGSSGVPDDLESFVRKYPVKTITKLRNYEDYKQACAQGYFSSICSNRGFKMKRDEKGFASPSGVWNHCMAGIGYITGSREGAWICNSWGSSAHTGPVGEGNPPPCGFYADAEVVDSMIKQGDSWCFSNVQGFPIRNWFI